MSFRLKLLLASVLSVVVAVGLVSWLVSVMARRGFERFYEQRTQALVEQFRRSYVSRSQEVVRRVERIAAAETVQRMAVDLSRPAADFSPYVNEAQGLAKAQALDFLELAANDGTIISSAHWPARFGYRNDWVTSRSDWSTEGAFLEREELPDEVALGLVTVAGVSAGESRFFVVGGQRLDKEFLAALALPAGMHAYLYSNLRPEFVPEALIDESGMVQQSGPLVPLIDEVRRRGVEVNRTVSWTPDPAKSEGFYALPLAGRGKALMGVLLVGSSRRELFSLTRFIRGMGILAGSLGVLLGVIFSYWAAGHLSRNIRLLVKGAREVAGGNWNIRVNLSSQDEIGQLAQAFDQMTQQLVEHRERAIQAERVAAWREVARRLAHELKNPLFPLQITVENLQRSRAHHPEQFDEVFQESTTTLLAELENLKVIIGRFSEFARMPPPQPEPVNLNELVHQVFKLFEAQFQTDGRPVIQPRFFLNEDLQIIQADPEQLRRALQNLILNAVDAMPDGGTVTVRTEPLSGAVRLEVSDSGTGLTEQECQRLFTPYYTTKQHGTGLGLAVVQSVVSDHGGKISVASQPSKGTTFSIELPERR